MFQFVLFLISAVYGVADCHLCMLSPPQRGSMVGLNKPGATDCVLVKAPCGGRGMNQPILELMAGSNFTITLQKNLDHFNMAAPGNFTISIGSSEVSLEKLVSFPDTSDPSLTLYSVNVTIPEMHGNTVLQSVYYTNNAKAPAAFHQCSDIRIKGKIDFYHKKAH